MPLSCPQLALQSDEFSVTEFVTSSFSPVSFRQSVVPDFTFPTAGRLGLTSPPSRTARFRPVLRPSVLSSAKTSNIPSLGLRTYCLAFRYLSVALFFSPDRGIDFPSVKPGTLITRLPFDRLALRRVLDLPSSQVLPVETCRVLRPRWYPRCTAASERGLLPSAHCKASAFPLCRSIGFILVSTTIQISGLNVRPASSFPLASHPGLPQAHAGFPTDLPAGIGRVGLPPELSRSVTH